MGKMAAPLVLGAAFTQAWQTPAMLYLWQCIEPDVTVQAYLMHCSNKVITSVRYRVKDPNCNHCTKDSKHEDKAFGSCLLIQHILKDVQGVSCDAYCTDDTLLLKLKEGWKCFFNYLQV